MEKIKKNLSKIYFIACIVAGVAFFTMIRTIVLATHDDILYYMHSRLGDVFSFGVSEAKRTGRFYFVYSMWVYCFPYILNSTIFLKLISYISITFSVFSLGCLMKECFDSHIAFLCVIFFFGFAQIDLQHNVFVSYILYHQIGIGCILFSLTYLIKYYKSEKKHQLLLSAFLYGIPLFLYEAYLFYSVCYFLIVSIYIWNKNEKRLVLDVVKDIRYHLVISLIFLGFYVGFKKMFPGSYDGASVSIESLFGSIKTIVYFGLGLFPLRSFYVNYRSINICQILQYLNIGNFIIAAIIAFSGVLAISKAAVINIKKYIAISLFCFVAIFLPCIPYGFTKKYCDWVKNGVYGFVPSYFGYFFIIIMLTLSAVILYQRCRFRKASQVIIFTIVFFVTLLTMVNNKNMSASYAHTFERYISFDKVVSSPEFLELKDETEVYIPDYTGIHFTMERSEKYLKIYSDKNIKLIKEKDKLDFSKEVYEIRYDDLNGITILGKINQDFMTDKIYILSNHRDLSNAKLNVDGKESVLDSENKNICIELYQGIEFNQIDICSFTDGK